MTSKQDWTDPMMRELRFPSAAPRQRGIALIIGLIILAVLSLIGVAAFSVSTQEERMAGNSRDRIRAFEAAEAALRDCESWAAGAGGGAGFAGTDGSYTAPPSPAASFTEGIDWKNPGNTVRTVPTGDITNPEWSRQPICVAEQIQVQSKPPAPNTPVQTTAIAHVTAQGYGTNVNTVVRLESYYAL
jgi:type IV pilus assembly protein PilX